MINLSAVRAVDPELAVSLDNELKRQRDHLELIASENYVSDAVLSAMGSHLTNKYAEGYPGKRYYGGCEWVDVAEKLAIERAKALFGAEHANVQPHSGAQANMAVYFSCLSPGDTVVAMSLPHGGHLTHGSPVNMSGKYYRFVPYGVSPKDEKIDYDQLCDIIKENKPKLVVAGASAYTRAIDFQRISEIAKENGALFLVDMAHISGLVAAGLHPDPVPFADYVTTTTHKTLRGPRGGMILCKKEHAKAIDKAIFPGTQGGPLMHTIAAKAVALKEALSPDFVLYQKKILENAKSMENAFHQLNVRMVSGGTDNHMLLLDLSETGRNGKEMEALLGQAYITVNKNTIPNEMLSPFVTSGVRIGTPAVTTRGMTAEDMGHVASLIARVLREGEDCTAAVRDEVMALCARYPLYEGEVL